MRKIVLSALAALTLTAGAAQAAGNAPKPEAQDWTFNGLFGNYDEAQLKRGFQIYREVCGGCHSLRLVAYRNLEAIGFTKDEIKEIAAEYELPAGPNEDGEILEDGELRMRSAKPFDKFVPPFANEMAAKAGNGGALPPDLSLMNKSRVSGPDYVYALLTGYLEEAPEGVEIPDGMYYNKYFPGHQISMAPPLDAETVEYEDGTEPTLENHAKDIVAFMNWAAAPELEERKSLGIKVMLFLILLTAMFYALKKRIWADVH